MTALLLGILLLLAAAVAVAYLLQDRLIYYPHRYSVAELRQAADVAGVQPWPAPDEAYRGLLSDGASGSRGTVVVFHGNGGSALNRLHYVAALEGLGFRVLLAEYPGYGARDGRLSEASLVADAEETVQRAARDFGGPLYVWGESLGSGVATAVVADPSLPVDGLVLITPFTSLADMAQAVYGPLPVRWLVRDRYDNVANLRGAQMPVAILVAERDELIPPHQAQALYDSLTTRKRLWIWPGAGHNTWPARAGAPWWREVAAFLEGD
jgi:alpha-beta hydrolase superfamily lysophospholipase